LQRFAGPKGLPTCGIHQPEAVEVCYGVVINKVLAMGHGWLQQTGKCGQQTFLKPFILSFQDTHLWDNNLPALILTFAWKEKTKDQQTRQTRPC